MDGTDSDVMDFGTVVSGSEDNTEGQFVTVTNTGNDTLHFTEISPEHFVVQDITAPLEAGESVQLWVSPRAGSEPGSYEDTITYTSEEGAQASFTARVTIQAADQNGEEPVLTPAENLQRNLQKLQQKNLQRHRRIRQAQETVFLCSLLRIRH